MVRLAIWPKRICQSLALAGLDVLMVSRHLESLSNLSCVGKIVPDTKSRVVPRWVTVCDGTRDDLS
jgi:hypothetical protein